MPNKKGTHFRFGFEYGAQSDDDAQELRPPGEQDGRVDGAPTFVADFLHVRPPFTALQRPGTYISMIHQYVISVLSIEVGIVQPFPIHIYMYISQ